MKLISMTDFVISAYDKIEDSLDSELAMYRYAMFLKQPLELWMFVPCDEEGNVLENPSSQKISDWFKKVKKYQQAKERCLFEGFDYKNTENWFGVLTGTIEELVKYKPEVTQTAIKQIGL